MNFIAAPKEDCRVERWNGLEDNSAAPAKEIVITDAITVSVSFKKSFAVQFACETAKGSITGKANGNPITPGKKLEEGTVVSFTAEAGEDYLIDTWYGLTAANGSSEASITVSENTQPVWLTFKKKTVNVSFSGAGNGTVTAAVNGNPINSGDPVEKGSMVLFTAHAASGYEADTWSGADGITVYPGKTQASLAVSSNTTITTSFVKQPERVTVTFNYDSDMGSVTAICDGRTVESDGKVLKNSSVSFLVQPKTGYEVTDWEGIDSEFIAPNKLTAKVTADKNIEVTVKMRKIPDSGRLTIFAKAVRNSSITGKDYIGLVASDMNGRYFVYDLRARIFENIMDNNQQFISMHSSNGGKDLVGIEQVKHAPYIEKNIAVSFDNNIQKEFSSLADIPYFELDTKVVGYNRAAAGAWRDQLNISRYGQSTVQFIYNKEEDGWKYKNPNFEIPNITVTLPAASFIVKRGESKDFTIKYITNPQTQEFEVTYTLKWE